MFKPASLFFIVLGFLFISTSAFSQDCKEYPLFPKGIKNNSVIHQQAESYVDSAVAPGSLSGENRVYSYISEPSYLLFPAADSNNKGIGLVIFPGGGMVNNWIDKEGIDIALWLSQKGVNCMVVKYRTNQRDEKDKLVIPYSTYKGAVYQDGRQSIITMKSLADSFNFDTNKVGVMGFSAGAWITSRMVIKYGDENKLRSPHFAGIIYGGQSKKAFKDTEDVSKLPPIFLATAADDHKLPLHKLIDYFTKVIMEVPKSELHIYAKGDHGFGLAYNNGYSVELWKNSFYRWMLDIYDL